MDIHKPHAAKTWKEFFIELGTVVLGILIALSLEQAVENWREHRQYESDREAVRSELGLQISSLMRRDTFGTCAAHRLEEVGQLLDRAEANQPFTPPSWIGRPLAIIIRTASETDVSRSNLFPTSEQQVYSLMYAWLHTTSQYQDQEQAAWSHLRPLEGRSSLSPAMIADMRTAIAEAHIASDRIRVNLAWLRLFARRYDIATNQNSEWTLMHPPVWNVCLPMNTLCVVGVCLSFVFIEKHQ